MSELFKPVKLGPYQLQHRVAMAPLTRMRSEEGDVPNELMREYYSQRTSAGGFIVSEATVVSPNGNGYLGAPGIYSDAQVPGWKRITDAVHEKGGRIFLQLFHAGRQSHRDMQPNRALPVGPSEVESEGLAYTANGWVPSTPNRALTAAEIRKLVEDFRSAADRGLEAGFDGVEIHGANGYIIDQFLHDGSNRRQDAYGGSIANRARFLLEIVKAAISVWGSDRVGVRLGPSGSFGDMSDSDPVALFTHVVKELDRLDLAYLHLIEPRIAGNSADESRDQNPIAARLFRQSYRGVIIAAGGFDADSADAIIAEGSADLVAFGRYFISNPDLPERFRRGLPLNDYDRDTFYGGTAVGYTDYPFHQTPIASQEPIVESVA
ncbi:alkene reductase [Burkholderia sp. Ac-20344]|uniref:alkene reductase n=1 Tax=Burkholderia sp. Ac-20344 TaxID=2703890 RepID=UPI00197B2671|nr:alkene reductase [Burkholderia sp. Ac-20344]MBN3834439.1 alkene reductase [Burkholderia sp. Ac-20344]